jgi:hypothetical protein
MAAWRSAAPAQRHFQWYKGCISLTGRRSSSGGGKLGATALTARMALDELTLELSIWGSAKRAANAVAPFFSWGTRQRAPSGAVAAAFR